MERCSVAKCSHFGPAKMTIPLSGFHRARAERYFPYPTALVQTPMSCVLYLPSSKATNGIGVAGEEVILGKAQTVGMRVARNSSGNLHRTRAISPSPIATIDHPDFRRHAARRSPELLRLQGAANTAYRRTGQRWNAVFAGWLAGAAHVALPRLLPDVHFPDIQRC